MSNPDAAAHKGTTKVFVRCHYTCAIGYLELIDSCVPTIVVQINVIIWPIQLKSANFQTEFLFVMQSDGKPQQLYFSAVDLLVASTHDKADKDNASSNDRNRAMR